VVSSKLLTNVPPYSSIFALKDLSRPIISGNVITKDNRASALAIWGGICNGKAKKPTPKGLKVCRKRKEPPTTPTGSKNGMSNLVLQTCDPFRVETTCWAEFEIPPSEGFNGCWLIVYYEHLTPTGLQNHVVTPTFRSWEAMNNEKMGFSPNKLGGITNSAQLRCQPQRG